MLVDNYMILLPAEVQSTLIACIAPGQKNSSLDKVAATGICIVGKSER